MRARSVLSILLLLALVMGLFPITCLAAQGFTVTLILPQEQKSFTGQTSFTLPAAQKAGSVFVGWCELQSGQQRLYPQGAVITLQGDTTLEAIFVQIRSLQPELREAGEGLGIRFLTAIDAADLERLSRCSVPQMGTLIAPAGFAGKEVGYALTHAGIRQSGHQSFVDLPVASFYKTSAKTVTIAGSLGNIRPENFSRVFLGIGYLKIPFADGTSAYIYAPTNRAMSGNYAKLLLAQEKTPTGALSASRVTAALEGVVAVSYSSATSYAVERDGALFEMSYHPVSVGEGTFVLRVRAGVDFNFDRDLRILLCNGYTQQNYRVQDGGKTLSITYSEYTSNY